MLHFAPTSLQRGMALLIVLLFLQIMTMLGLYSLSSSLLSEKMNSENWQKESTILVMDELLRTIAIQLQNEIPPCVMMKSNSLNLLTKSMDWWQSSITCKGCFHQEQYYYVIEQLGEDPCAQFAGKDMRQLAVHYFRIWLLTMVKKTNMKIILQSTVTRLFNRIAPCGRASYVVSIGQQTWREI